MKTPTMKLALAALAALPLAALAAPPPGPGQGSGRGMDPFGDSGDRHDRMERRMRVARAVGLAEALDLDAPQATKLAEALEKLDQKRQAPHKQQEEAMEVLRQAARGDKDAQGKVDDAVKKVFDARAQLQAVDRETYEAVAKGLPPDKRARAAVFLGRFRERLGRGMAMMDLGGMEGMAMGWGRGMDGPGMGQGMMGRGHVHMGRGMDGPGQGPGRECPDEGPRR